MHAKDFDSALVKRNRALTQLIEDANKFLHDNPPGAIGPPVTRNNYFDSLGEFSISRDHAPRDPPKYVPPSALPAAVLTPPKRKASDQPQRKKRPPPPRHRPSQQSPAQHNTLWTPTCSLLAPVPPPPAPPRRDGAQAQHKWRKRSEPPPPRPHTLLIPNSLGSTDSSRRTSGLNLLYVSPHASSNSLRCS